MNVIQSPGGKSKRSPLHSLFKDRRSAMKSGLDTRRGSPQRILKKSKEHSRDSQNKDFSRERCVPTKATAQGLAIHTDDMTDTVDSKTFVHMIGKSTLSPKEKRTTQTPGHILDIQTKSVYAVSTLKARVHSEELGDHLWFFLWLKILWQWNELGYS